MEADFARLYVKSVSRGDVYRVECCGNKIVDAQKGKCKL